MRKRYFKLSVESHIHFRMQSVIMTPAGGRGRGGEGVITNDVLEFKKIIEFQRS